MKGLILFFFGFLFPSLGWCQLSQSVVRKIPVEFQPKNIADVSPKEVINILTQVGKRQIQFEDDTLSEQEFLEFLTRHFAQKYPLIQDWQQRATYTFYLGAYLTTIVPTDQRVDTINKYFKIFERDWKIHPKELNRMGARFLMFRASMLASYRQNNLPYALHLMEQSLQVSKELNDSSSMSNAYISIANVYNSVKLFNKAIVYLDSSERFPCRGKDCYSDYLNHLVKKYEIYFNRYKLLRQQKDADTIRAFLGYYQLKLKPYNDVFVNDFIFTMYAKLAYFEGDYRSCLNYFDTVKKLPIDIHSGTFRYEPNPELYIGLSLLHLNQPKEAYTILDNIPSAALESDENLLLYEKYLYERKRNHAGNALSFLEAYLAVHDKDQLLQHQGQILEMEQRLNLVDVQRKLSVQTAKNNRYLLWSSIILFLFIVLVLILFYRYKISRQKTHTLLQLIEEQATIQIIRLEQAAQEAELKERKRIGQNLHDNLAGTIAGLLNFMETRATKEENQTDKQQLLNAASMLKKSYQQTREMAHEEFQAEDESCFGAILLDTINIFFSGTEISVTPEIEVQEMAELSMEKKTTILLILKELVTNIIKHAQASSVEISLFAEQGIINLIVEDNGVGFKVSKSKKSMGLLSISKRLETVHGTVSVEANPDGGTIVSVHIPNDEAVH
ncbi:MAG: sensor histidine kinase [Bacteroidetes bacterium]|nr:sensor histidine kinase [Bacteroidota bacterium]